MAVQFFYLPNPPVKADQVDGKNRNNGPHLRQDQGERNAHETKHKQDLLLPEATEEQTGARGPGDPKNTQTLTQPVDSHWTGWRAGAFCSR